MIASQKPISGTVVTQSNPFPVGTHVFHAEPNMNYQFNRVHSICGGDFDEIREAAGRIRTLADWTEIFLNLAEKSMMNGKKRSASAYYRAANFYLDAHDPRKMETYEIYTRMAREMYDGDFTSGKTIESQIPYENGFLPVWFQRAQPGTGMETASDVILHLGYDSLKEELYPVMDLFSAAGFNIYLFEGPGQGEALYHHGLAMTHEWEKPVKAILDFFGLDDVTLIGLSLGGFLAPRAAAFEPRIRRVIAWGILHDFLDVVVSRRGPLLEGFLRVCLSLNLKGILNAVVRMKMTRDTYTKWGVDHGMFVFGVKTPFDYFRSLAAYNIKPVASRIRQDVLLLGSTDDHFIPEGDFIKEIEVLDCVRSLTTRLFTKAEHAENHVQFGNIPLAVRCMIDWISERIHS